MRSFFAILITVTLFALNPAFAQCTGQFAAGAVCGNSSLVPAPPRPIPSNSLIGYVNVKLLGARGDGLSGANGAITSGLTAFTSAGASFTTADIGKVIQVAGAGAAGVPLNTTIAGFVSSTAVTLTAAASTTVSGATYIYGTNDTTAIQAAINTVTPPGYPSTVFMPNGIYMLTSGLTISSNVTLFGENHASVILIPAPATTAIAINSNATVKISGLQINYIAQAGGGAGITLTGPGEGNENSVFRDLQINNPTYGILTNSSIRTVIDNVGVFNFTQNCFAITNPASPDAGDDLIINSNCQDGSFTKTAIYYASSSGLRVTNTKFLNVRYCLSVELANTLNVSQMTFNNNGCDGAIAGLNFVRAGATGTFGRVIVVGNSFNLNTVAINIPLDPVAPWLSGLVVTGNMYKDGGAAGSAFVSINSTDDFYVGANTLISTVGTTVEAVIGSTATNGILAPNSKSGTFTANTISSTSIRTPVSSSGNFLKVAAGETALDGTNPTPVTTGLASIVSCALTIKSTSAPGLGTSVVTYGTSSGTLNMYGWKPTGAGDTTLIASTGTETIGWSCAGN